MIFGLSLLLVYLVLSAQYESFILPLIILLGVPLAVFGALSAQLLRGFNNDVFCQVGLVLLVGLAAKNSILIVEFAEQLRERGLSIVDAAIESARIRLRPILMTSFAFILGVHAAGAGDRRRRGVAQLGRHGGRGRHAGLDVPVDRLHPGAVCRDSLDRSRVAAHRDRGDEATADARSAGASGPRRDRRPWELSSRSRSRRPRLRRLKPALAADACQPVETVTFDEAIARALEKNPSRRDRGDEHPALRGVAAAGARADACRASA